jgi:hypothetical protein
MIPLPRANTQTDVIDVPQGVSAHECLFSQKPVPLQSDRIVSDNFDKPRTPNPRSREFQDEIFNLPREVRDWMYEYVWEGTHIRYQEVICASSVISVRYLDCNGACEEDA